MCGIGAYLDVRGDLSPGGRMIPALRHRGPDGEGTWRCGPALLVHTRLAIIDLAGGRQPLVSEDGTSALAVNGEIYNHLRLRRDLEARGHVFATRSDSEVILHGYEEWGLDVVDRLNGIFAFVLWDGHRSRLVTARDHFGVKPLYWWSDGRRLAAASEIGALLATGAPGVAPDPIAMEHLLAWRFVPAPRTLFEGIHKLPAAAMLIFDERGPSVRSFRRPPGTPIDGATPSELECRLRGELLAAVERQMMSDVPYGAFLSGGLDSSAIAASMARAGCGRPQTFTVGFPGHGGRLDERPAAASTARVVGACHHETAMRMGDFLAELGPTVRRVEEPCGTASAPAALQLSRFTAQNVKVVLSGQGADEPLGGYQRHQAAAAMAVLDGVPSILHAPLRRAACALPRNERVKRAAELLAAGRGRERLLQVFEITTADTRSALSRGPAADAARERAALAAEVLADVQDRDPLEQALYLDTHLFLPDQLLVWGDKTSMAWGLEQRVPFLDVELMRYVERIPARLRVRRLQRKWLYRRSLRGLLPEDVLRRRKHPFATPYDEWLRADLGAEVRRRFAAGGPLGETIRPSGAERLVAEHQSGRADHKRILYCLLELSEWHRCFVDGGPQLADASVA
jgi:asparagine synthase (glutamine-hydrolysing)